MSLSSGTRHLLGEALGWGAVAVVGAIALVHYDDLKRASAELLGLAAPAETAGAHPGVPAPEPRRQSASGAVELQAGADGHFHVEVEINGRPIETMVDTGATMVALSYQDAERAGVYVRPADFTMRVNTANGIARAAPVTLDEISLGDITVRNVRAAVSEPGRLQGSLLGMSFLGRLSRFEMRAGVLVLQD